jgi:hypothetical protein
MVLLHDVPKEAAGIVLANQNANGVAVSGFSGYRLLIGGLV